MFVLIIFGKTKESEGELMKITQGLIVDLTSKEIECISGGIEHKIIYGLAIGVATFAYLVNVIGLAKSIRLSGGIIVGALCKTASDRYFRNEPFIKHMVTGYCTAITFIEIAKITGVTIPTNPYNYYNVTNS